MKILKEGTVIFKSGKVKEICNFHVKEGTCNDLAKYVLSHYTFKSKK